MGIGHSTQAVHDALPLLHLAGEVLIVIADADKSGVRFGHQPGASILAYLGRHEVTARMKAVANGGTAIAELILTQAAEENAVLVVIGDYRHSHLVFRL